MTLLSRRALLNKRVAEAEELYLLALSDAGVPAGIKEKALYQLGLMYLAPDNPRAERDKAIGYLRRLLVQPAERPGRAPSRPGAEPGHALTIAVRLGSEWRRLHPHGHQPRCRLS